MTLAGFGAWATVMLTLGLPTLAGTALVVIGLRCRPGQLLWLWCLAAGHLLGLGLTALLLAIARTAVGASSLLWVTAAGLALLAMAALVMHFKGGAERPAPDRLTWADAEGPAARALWWLLAAWMVLVLALCASEVLLRPVYPWDAWSAWAVKAKVWTALGPTIDFVSFQDWVSSSAPDRYTNEAWNYPETLPLIQYWMTAWHGGWHSAAANLPWISCGLALALLTYTTGRLSGLAPGLAMTVTFALQSLPILTTQLALAGYADIWVGAGLLLFAAALLAYLSGWVRLWLPLTALALVCALKLEGVVWAIIGLTTLIYVHLSGRGQVMVAVVAAATFTLWLLMDGFSVTLAGLTFTVTPGLVELPYLGRHPLGFDNQLASLGAALIELPNWHLLWMFGVPLMVYAAWQQRTTREGLGLGVFLLLGLGFLFVLFFFTQAAAWAESMTASNRLALHLAPAAGLWAAVLLGGQRDGQLGGQSSSR